MEVLRHVFSVAVACCKASAATWCSSLHDDAAHTALQRVAWRCRTSCCFLCSWAVAWRSHLLAGLTLLFFLPAHVAAQTAFTDANLSTAVIAWVTNPTTATTTYGPIADWNTAAVSNMANLLYPTVAPSTSGTARPTFNSDISKWNVASVSNMYLVTTQTMRLIHVAMYLRLYLHTDVSCYTSTQTLKHMHTHTYICLYTSEWAFWLACLFERACVRASHTHTHMYRCEIPGY
jgi:hypothetical protein